MRPVRVADVALRLEAAEAGGRYLAPILVLPGLFQSWVCWRGMTSMLAHRGWNVYLLPRSRADAGETLGSAASRSGAERRPASHASGFGEDGDARRDWSACVADAAAVAAALDEKVIVLGADVGAAIALSIAEPVRPLALALFAPAAPAHVGRAYDRSLGIWARRRARKDEGVRPPPAMAKRVYRETDASAEPRALVEDLVAGVPFTVPAEHPPAIVFQPQDDPLVDPQHAATFADTTYAKPARARVNGRWWPSSRWEPIADEVHRFLILTLADRVVEFPDEVVED